MDNQTVFNPSNIILSSEDITLLYNIFDNARKKYIDVETGKQVKRITAHRRYCHLCDDLLLCSHDKERLDYIIDKVTEIKRNNKNLSNLALQDGLKRSRKIMVAREESNAGVKTRRKKISKNIREHLWLRDYGNVYQVICLCCRLRFITPLSAECGHIIAHAHGGKEEVGNLVMICHACNKDMGTMSMIDYMRKLHCYSEI